MTRLVLVCGLAAEARIAARDDLPVIMGGGDGPTLAATLAALGPDVPALLSFGVAGGLDPLLRPGNLRVATEVVIDGERIAADASWRTTLAAALAVPGVVFAGSDTIVADVAAKATLHASTDAACVDMETHIVAREARRRGIPWAAIRAVTDPAERALPHAAAVGMRPDGKNRPAGHSRVVDEKPRPAAGADPRGRRCPRGVRGATPLP